MSGKLLALLYVGLGILVFSVSVLGFNRIYGDDWGFSTFDSAKDHTEELIEINPERQSSESSTSGNQIKFIVSNTFGKNSIDFKSLEQQVFVSDSGRRSEYLFNINGTLNTENDKLALSGNYSLVHKPDRQPGELTLSRGKLRYVDQKSFLTVDELPYQVSTNGYITENLIGNWIELTGAGIWVILLEEDDPLEGLGILSYTSEFKVFDSIVNTLLDERFYIETQETTRCIDEGVGKNFNYKLKLTNDGIDSLYLIAPEVRENQEYRNYIYLDTEDSNRIKKIKYIVSWDSSKSNKYLDCLVYDVEFTDFTQELNEIDSPESARTLDQLNKDGVINVPYGKYIPEYSSSQDWFDYSYYDDNRDEELEFDFGIEFERKITFSSKDNYEKVAKFYKDELEKLGWERIDNRPGDDYPDSAIMKSGGLLFKLRRLSPIESLSNEDHEYEINIEI